MAKMSRSKAPFLWMTVLVLLIIVVPQPQPVASQFRPSQPEVGCYASENTGVLTGIVTSSDTQQPINKVLVRLYRPYNRNTEFSSLNYALTDDTGRYTLPAVKQDLYRISFSNSPLYAKEWYSDTASQFAAPAVLINAGITTTIDAKLELGGTITGHITDKDTGSPLANVSVTAFSDGGPMGGNAIERTDATGQYSLTHLHTGSYVIGAQSISYYNDAINYAEANPVTIASGGVISNIHF